MNLRNLNDEGLVTTTEALVREERELLTYILHHLREIDRRRLFSELGFKSLFDMAVKKFGYSESQAYRRITAMRLLKELPEVEEMVTSGELNLSHLGLAQSMFKQEKKSEAGEMPREQKIAVLHQLVGTSAREAEKITSSLCSTPQSLKADRVHQVTAEQVELKFIASTEVLGQIERLKGLLAHSYPQLSLGELFEKLCDLGIEAWSPASAPRSNSRSASTSSSRLASGSASASTSGSSSTSTSRSAMGSASTSTSTSKSVSNSSSRSASASTSRSVSSSNSSPSGLSPTSTSQKLRVIGSATESNGGITSSIPASCSITASCPIATSGTNTVSSAEQSLDPLSKSGVGTSAKNMEERSGVALQATSRKKSKKKSCGPRRSAIPVAIKREVFRGADQKCESCGSRHALQIDHIRPVAKGGGNGRGNLRLLCRNCNLRAGIREFGQHKMGLFLT